MVEVVTEAKGMKRKRGSVYRRKSGVEGCTLCCRCSPRCVMDLLELHLDVTNLKILKQSCFGHFLNFPILSFQNHLNYFLMKNLDTSAKNSGFLRFNFNGVEASFVPDEFVAITGLSFGPPMELSTSSVLYDVVFQSQRRILLKQLEHTYIVECRRLGGSGELALKLGLSFFMYATLMSKGYNSQKIDLTYLHIVYNIATFNSYPWDRVAYDYFVSEYYESNHRLQMNLCQKKPSVDLFVFILALQVWAYEVFPKVGDQCAYLYSDYDRISPRIMRWWNRETFKYEEIEPFFPPMCGSIEMEPFIVSTEEANQILKARSFYSNVEKNSGILETPVKIQRALLKRKLKFVLNDGPVISTSMGNPISPTTSVTPCSNIASEVTPISKNLSDKGPSSWTWPAALLVSPCDNQKKTENPPTGPTCRIVSYKKPEPDLSTQLSMSEKVNALWDYFGPLVSQSKDLKAENINEVSLLSREKDIRSLIGGKEASLKLMLHDLLGIDVFVKPSALDLYETLRNEHPNSEVGRVFDDDCWIDKLYLVIDDTKNKYSPTDATRPESSESVTSSLTDDSSNVMSTDTGDNKLYTEDIDVSLAVSAPPTNHSNEGDGRVDLLGATEAEVGKKNSHMYSPVKKYSRAAYTAFKDWYRFAAIGEK